MARGNVVHKGLTFGFDIDLVRHVDRRLRIVEMGMAIGGRIDIVGVSGVEGTARRLIEVVVKRLDRKTTRACCRF